MIKRYISGKELSTYISMAEKTLSEWANQGRIPSLKLGRKRIYDIEQIDSWIAGKKSEFDQSEETVNKILEEIHG